MPPITATKAALRTRLRRAAADLPPEVRAQSDRSLFPRFLSLPQVGAAGTLLLFYGVGTEPATAALLAPLWAAGKRLYLPRCGPAGTMEAVEVRPGDPLVPDRYGIPAPGADHAALPPEDLDLILVPALCYDRTRARLGQGGGYYDRFLARTPSFTVGLCRDRLLQDVLPTEPHDRRVDLVLTETRCLTA